MLQRAINNLSLNKVSRGITIGNHISHPYLKIGSKSYEIKACAKCHYLGDEYNMTISFTLEIYHLVIHESIVCTHALAK